MNKSSLDPSRYKSMTCYQATDPYEKSSLSQCILVDRTCSVKQTPHKTSPQIQALLPGPGTGAGAERAADRQGQCGAQTALNPSMRKQHTNVKWGKCCRITGLYSTETPRSQSTNTRGTVSGQILKRHVSSTSPKHVENNFFFCYKENEWDSWWNLSEVYELG